MIENTSIIQGPASTSYFDAALFEGDSEFLNEIVSLFLSTCPELLSELEDAVSRKDAQGMRRAAHTLKGAVANFGAAPVVEQAHALEIIGLKENLLEADEAWRALRDLMGELESELQAVLNKPMEKQVLT